MQKNSHAQTKIIIKNEQKLKIHAQFWVNKNNQFKKHNEKQTSNIYINIIYNLAVYYIV